MGLFDWNLVLRIFPLLLPALYKTIEATLLGMTVALILGLLFALARYSPVHAVKKMTAVFVEFIRRTPLLVQVYFLFYMLPATGLQLSAFTTGVLALGLHYAAYCSEVYRAGIEAVPSGQWDAASALNLGAGYTMYRVILPQALVPILPALSNYLISMFKDTPILSAITVVELLQESKILGSESFRYTEPLTMVGIFFLVLSLICAGLSRSLENFFALRRR
jgi:polar amino acid transport system permease protein